MGGASVTGTRFSSSASAVARNICFARRFPNPLKNEQITSNDKATHLANFAFHLVTLINSWPKIFPKVYVLFPSYFLKYFTSLSTLLTLLLLQFVEVSNHGILICALALRRLMYDTFPKQDMIPLKSSVPCLDISSLPI